MAAVDQDKAPRRDRLRALQEERKDARQKGSAFPTALGEARPHGEAWLLDDPVCLREVLGLAKDASIPSVRQRRDCQACIEEIIRESGVDKRPLEVYGRLAAKLVLERCAHAVETGFEAFVEEVRAEIGPMVAKPST